MNEQEAIHFLQQLGYTILPPETKKSKLSATSIIDFFYQELKKKSNNLYSPELYSPNKDKDLKEITRYQEKAARDGLSKTESLTQLLKALQLFFKYFDELGLKNNISLGFILSNKGSWIFSKLQDLHLKKIDEYENGLQGQQFRDQIETTECTRFLTLIDDRLKEVLKLKETENGKEEISFRGKGFPKSV